MADKSELDDYTQRAYDSLDDMVDELIRRCPCEERDEAVVNIVASAMKVGIDRYLALEGFPPDKVHDASIELLSEKLEPILDELYAKYVGGIRE